MKRFLVAILCALSATAMVQAQEQPAAAAPAAPAAPAAEEAKGGADPIHQQMVDLKRQINTLEAEVRKSNPGISAKLDEIEKQRQQVFVQAKPELEALYAQQEALQAQAKQAQGRKQGGQKAKGQAGEGKPGKAEKKAGKKAAGKP